MTLSKSKYTFVQSIWGLFALGVMPCAAQDILWYPQPLHVVLDTRNPEAASACCFAYDHGCLAQGEHVSSNQVIRDVMNQLIRKLLERICARLPGAERAGGLFA